MANKPNAILQDVELEKAVLQCIISNGPNCFFQIEELLTGDDFYWTKHKKLFKLLSHLAYQEDVKSYDLVLIQVAAKTLGFTDFLQDGENYKYLTDLVSHPGATTETILPTVAVVYKLSLARKGYLAAVGIQDNMKKVTGGEGVDQIIECIEEPIFSLTGKLNDQNSGSTSLGHAFFGVMTQLATEPKDVVGLPTGFPLWDIAIGGGLRPATVSVVGARPKIGKSWFCLNVAKNVAMHGIPVLYLDTELTGTVQIQRLTALMTGVELSRIETGKFVTNTHEEKAVFGAKEQMEKLTIEHVSVAGLSPQAIVSIARRWVAKTVGFTASGAAKPCVIIYDYLKLMDDGGLKGNLQEYQALGFLVTALHNFAVKFKLPILATVQLNRDGVEKEGSEVVSGSDRIVWLCSNFSILKNKTSNELNEDPPANGTKKIFVTDTRYGPGMPKGEYINIIDKLSHGELREGKPFSFVLSSAWNNKQK